MPEEIDLIKQRYARRNIEADRRYSPLLASVYMAQQEKERALIKVVGSQGLALEKLSLLEIGCGSGMNLLQLIRLGFRPENLTANELLEERLELAVCNLPGAVKILAGDASSLDVSDESYDIIYQSVVFSSILDQELQSRLAAKMWRLLKPGGAVLWYDFTYDNPKNSDVQGVPFKRISEMFPTGNIARARITLAPPISRLVTRVHPSLYTLFNMFPFLRTHLLCWIRKEG